MTHLVIIGGSDAGISAALRAREIDEQVKVTWYTGSRPRELADGNHSA